MHTWRLPRALVDGEAATVFVTWDDADPNDLAVGGVPKVTSTADPTLGVRDAHQTLTYGVHEVVFDRGPGACGKRKLAVIRGLPLWMGSSPDAVLDPDPLPLSSLHVVGPAGLADPTDRWTEVGIGPQGSCVLADFEGFPSLAAGGSCFEVDGLEVRPACQTTGCTVADVDLRIFVGQDLDRVASPDHPDVAVYVDSCFGGALAAEVAAHFAAGGRFTADRAQVEAWLGPWPLERASIVLMPGAMVRNLQTGVLFESGTAGSTLPGSHLVTSFDMDGTANDDPDGQGWLLPADWRQVTIHEWSHTWAGVRRSHQPESDWLLEALPALVGTIVYPEGGANVDRLVKGHGLLVANTIAPAPPAGSLAWPRDLELNATTDAIDHYIGPYTLSQMLFAASAASSNYADAEAALAAFGQALFPVGSLYEPLTATDIATATGSLGLVDFYAEWIAAGRFGTPVLGAVATVDPSGVVTFTAQQLQSTRLHDAMGVAFPVFSEVPAFLACSPTLDPTATLAGCTAPEQGPPVARPELVPAVGGLVVTPSLPSRFALLAGPQLLPGHVGAYGISDGESPIDRRAGVPVAPTWWIACPAGSPDPFCATDLDGDGWAFRNDEEPPSTSTAFSGDCDDAPVVGFTTNPATPDAAGPWVLGTLDHDCDGWPSPAFFTPDY